MGSSCSTRPAPELPPEPRLALVVATTTYSDRSLRQLRAPARDAADLAEVLADAQIGGFAVTSVLDRTAHEIRRAVEDFLTDRGTADLLVVYLSCHGLIDARRRLYFATTDTMKSRLASTGVEAQWLMEQMEDCRARRQVLILDCCFSGAFAHGSKGDTDVGLEERFLGHGRGRVVLTASRATESSFEGDRTPGATAASVFTAGLVEGLRTGKADLDNDGYVSVDEAYAYAFQHVRAVGVGQTPQRWLYGAEGNILLARSPAGITVTAAPLAESIRQGLDSPYPAIRLGAVAALGEWLTDSDQGRVLTARTALQQIADNDIRSVAVAAQTLLDPVAPATIHYRFPAARTPANDPQPDEVSTDQSTDHTGQALPLISPGQAVDDQAPPTAAPPIAEQAAQPESSGKQGTLPEAAGESIRTPAAPSRPTIRRPAEPGPADAAAAKLAPGSRHRIWTATIASTSRRRWLSAVVVIAIVVGGGAVAARAAFLSRSRERSCVPSSAPAASEHSNSQDRLPDNLYFGDIDGDHSADFIQFSGSKLIVFRADLDGRVLIEKFFDYEILRVIVGDFTTCQQHGIDQICVIFVNNRLACYYPNAARTDLSLWFTQTNFIAKDEESIIGDFDGDGADDVFVYRPSTGDPRMYSRSSKGVFQPTADFDFGNLLALDRRNKLFYAGEFGGGDDRTDLLVLDTTNGQLFAYVASIIAPGRSAFWWAWTTKAGAVATGDQLTVANIDGGPRDGIAVHSGATGGIRLTRLRLLPGVGLEQVPSVDARQLSTYSKPGSRVYFARMKYLSEAGGMIRDDALILDEGTRSMTRVDSHSGGKGNLTYSWSYTKGIPVL
jgi:hypothetical protein